VCQEIKVPDIIDKLTLEEYLLVQGISEGLCTPYLVGRTG